MAEPTVITISANEENKIIDFIEWLMAEKGIELEDIWATEFLTFEFIQRWKKEQS